MESIHGLVGVLIAGIILTSAVGLILKNSSGAVTLIKGTGTAAQTLGKGARGL